MTRTERRTAVVTGASRGIGLAIARELARKELDVVLAARSGEGLAAALEQLGGGEGLLAVRCDVRSSADCRQLVQAAVERFGGLDVLVNNAGIGRFAPVAELDPEAWDAVLGTNLDGVFYCCHWALPHLRRSADGWIINIGSLAGKNAFAGGAAYNASKFGLIGFSEALMQEVRHDGIRVSYIMPGSVATEFSHPTRGGDSWKIQPEDVARAVADLLDYPSRTLPSRIEVRPSRPPRK
jgi:3-oxoacyl-[acyl-carrier protein] reductase